MHDLRDEWMRIDAAHASLLLASRRCATIFLRLIRCTMLARCRAPSGTGMRAHRIDVRMLGDRFAMRWRERFAVGLHCDTARMGACEASALTASSRNIERDAHARRAHEAAAYRVV
jgi:hypothetical protein